MEAIYAIDEKNGLSKDGIIPWKSKKDMKFFMNKTIGNVVIMGKNTYFSLPENVRPLKDRLNIVLTSRPNEYSDNKLLSNNNLVFTDYENICNALIINKEKVVKSHPYLRSDFIIYFIGGKIIYEKFIPICERIWVTRIKGDYKCDVALNYNYSKYFKEPKKIDEDEELEISVYEKKHKLFLQ